MMSEVERMISQGSNEQAIDLSLELIELARDGLSYYHNYDRFFLG